MAVRARANGVSGAGAKSPRRRVEEKLAKYRSMRDFHKTAEPSGHRAPHAAGNSYVIQQHAARRLHYDFRLELDGVLLSWSVPKGPSLSPTERRLAVRTEDHPLDYANFEGIIPKGEYGGGTVCVWDRGTWTPEGDAHEGMRRGRLTFSVDGHKLRGRFHLVRTKPQGNQETWLLFKSRDEAANENSDIVTEKPESVLTRRTLEQIADDADKVERPDFMVFDLDPDPDIAWNRVALAAFDVRKRLEPATFTTTTVPSRLASLQKDPWGGIDDVDDQAITAAAWRALGGKP